MKNEKLDEIMKKRGISVVAQDDGTDRKVPPQAKGCEKLMETYYTLKNTADMEIPYWYNRVWW